MQKSPDCDFTLEPFVTLRQAAEKLGRPYWQIQRLVKTGVVPVYFIGNQRRLLLLSELNEIIQKSKTGGEQ